MRGLSLKLGGSQWRGSQAADEAADPATEMEAAGAGATSVLTEMREGARSRMAEIAAEKQRRRVEAETAAEKERLLLLPQAARAK